MAHNPAQSVPSKAMTLGEGGTALALTALAAVNR